MKKIKIKKKVVIPVAILLVIVAFVGYNATVSASAPQVTTVETYAAEVTDLENTVDVTGMVESQNVTNVYSSMTYPIAEVDVEVGDKVAEGDVLCRLDTSDLESTIAQNQASVWAAQQKANHNLAVAEKDLETEKFNVEGDYNTAILNAESAVKAAETGLLAAEHKVADRRRTIRDLRDDKLQVEDDETYDERITEEKKSLVQEELTLEQAQQDLEDAKATLRAVKMQQQETQISTQDQVTSAKLNTNFSEQYIAIQKLQEDVGKATVLAPVSGTVTAVYAVEGASGSGLLFVIEDTDRLKVTTTVMEYDIASVTEGLPVSIKADGTGEEEFSGVVAKISPTTKKDDTGRTVDTNSAEFPAEIEITGRSNLRIGMNARLKIIVEKKESVLRVPFESIVEDEEGNTAVFVMDDQGDGTFLAKKVPVETGMETDFYSEIVSSELKEGDKVIVNSLGLEEGTLVAEADAEALQQAMMA